MGLSLFTGTKWNKKYLEKINPNSFMKSSKQAEKLMLKIFQPRRIVK